MSQYNTISGNKSLIKAKKNKEYFERILNFFRCKKGNGSLTGYKSQKDFGEHWLGKIL